MVKVCNVICLSKVRIMQNLRSIAIEMVPVNKKRHDINRFLSLARKIFLKYLQILKPKAKFLWTAFHQMFYKQSNCRDQTPRHWADV